MLDSKPHCKWLLVEQEKTCCRLTKCDGYCNFHAKQKIKTVPCITCGKGTRSKYGACYKKGCVYEKLRYITNKKKN